MVLSIMKINTNCLNFSSNVWKQFDQESKLQLHILNDKDAYEQSSADVDNCANSNAAKTDETVQHHHKKTKVITTDKDHNYLSLSDTDTVDCYTVPSPVYPSSPTTPIYPSFSTLPLPGPSSMKRMSRENQIFNLYSVSEKGR